MTYVKVSKSTRCTKLELESIILSALITVIFQAILALAAYKIAMARIQKQVPDLVNLALNSAKNYAEEWINSETGQKAIYQLGQLAGNGAKSALTGKAGSGKYGWIETAISLFRNLKDQGAQGQPGTSSAEPTKLG